MKSKNYLAVFALIIFFLISIHGVSAEPRPETPVKVEVEVTGELIDLGESPEVSEVTGTVKIFPSRNGFVNVKIIIHQQRNEKLMIKSQEVPIVWESIMTTDQQKLINAINIDDYQTGVFISITFLSDGSTQLHLATNTLTKQYDLSGTIENALALGFAEERIIRMDTTMRKEIEIAPNIIKDVVSVSTPETGQLRLLATREKKSRTSTTIITTKSELDSNPPYQPRKLIRPTFYGLVHEVFFDADNDVPELVPGWLVSGTYIDRGIIVDAPSEARIKSDYRTYNTYYYYDELSSRELWAYEIDTHGKTSVDEPDRPLLGSDSSWLNPSEVTGIWHTYESYEVKPHSTVIFSSACKSYYEADEIGSGTPEMAQAWCDYGAAAYVGSTFNLPIVMDDFTREFWRSICFDEQTVGQAEDDASTTMGWDDDDMLVYGNTGKTIP